MVTYEVLALGQIALDLLERSRTNGGAAPPPWYRLIRPAITTLSTTCVGLTQGRVQDSAPLERA
jgi:hypothetical protein